MACHSLLYIETIVFILNVLDFNKPKYLNNVVNDRNFLSMPLSFTGKGTICTPPSNDRVQDYVR